MQTRAAPSPLTLMLRWCLRCKRKGPDLDWGACPLLKRAPPGRSQGVWQLLLPPGGLWAGRWSEASGFWLSRVFPAPPSAPSCQKPHLHLGPADLAQAGAPPRHCSPFVSHGSSLEISAVRWRNGEVPTLSAQAQPMPEAAGNEPNPSGPLFGPTQT